MAPLEQVRNVVQQALGLGEHHAQMQASYRLLGNLPELDSMGVVQLVTALETQFGIVIDDDDMRAATFETLGSVTALVQRKLAE